MTRAARAPQREPGPREIQELLAQADELLQADAATAGSWWPRAVAFSLRAALEAELDLYWRRRGDGVQRASRKAQLIVLRAQDYAGPDVGRRVAAAWYELTRACHHHAYELAPTAAELRSLYVTVEQARNDLRQAASPGSG